MISLVTPALVMLFLLRGTRTQTLTQPEVLVTVSEGDPLDLKCTYSYSGFIYLYWYVQYPNQEPQFLLKSVTGSNLVKGFKGFEAEFNKNKTSFHLKKFSAQESDSAEYFCALDAQ